LCYGRLTKYHPAIGRYTDSEINPCLPSLPNWPANTTLFWTSEAWSWATARTSRSGSVSIYLDFCHKYTFEPSGGKSLAHFDGKLQEKGQADWMRRQAQQAVSLCYELIAERHDDVSTLVAAPPPPAGVGRDTSQCGDNLALRRKIAGRSPSTGAAPLAAMTPSVPVASPAAPMAETFPLSGHAVPGPTAPSVRAPRVAEGMEDGCTPAKQTGVGWVSVYHQRLRCQRRGFGGGRPGSERRSAKCIGEYPTLGTALLAPVVQRRFGDPFLFGQRPN
jgi:hypothetical protein